MAPSSPVAASVSEVACSHGRAHHRLRRRPAGHADHRAAPGAPAARSRSSISSDGLTDAGIADAAALSARTTTTHSTSKSRCWQGNSIPTCGWSPGWATACCGRPWRSATAPAPSSTSRTWPRHRWSRPACRAPRTRSPSAGIEFVVSGTDAPRDATLRELFGDLAPVAVVRGEHSATPGEVVACPGRDVQVSAGDWTAMIGTAEELAAQGIAVAAPAAAAGQPPDGNPSSASSTRSARSATT